MPRLIFGSLLGPAFYDDDVCIVTECFSMIAPAPPSSEFGFHREAQLSREVGASKDLCRQANLFLFAMLTTARDVANFSVHSVQMSRLCSNVFGVYVDCYFMCRLSKCIFTYDKVVLFFGNADTPFAIATVHQEYTDVARVHHFVHPFVEAP